jgi:hypothetical protein
VTGWHTPFVIPRRRRRATGTRLAAGRDPGRPVERISREHVFYDRHTRDEPCGETGNNATLALNTTRLGPGDAVRFTITATDGPVRFSNSDTHDVQRWTGEEWRDLNPGEGGATVIVTVEQGESRTATWTPGDLPPGERAGRYRVVYSTLAGDVSAEFRVVVPTLTARPAELAFAPGGRPRCRSC